MQGGRSASPGPRLWLFAGTGEGPGLADSLLRQGWRLRVSVVTAAAAAAYAAHPRLELAVGALAGPGALHRSLRRAEAEGQPFALLVDATHPFAAVIQATLAAAGAAHGLPVLRLRRPQWQPDGSATLLEGFAALAELPPRGERLLLAIGARHLATAVGHSPGALHHARLLPSPQGLQAAMAAGLAPERVACLRPTASGAIETALVRRWRIGWILARQSGGQPERLWHRIAEREGSRLLLLQRPGEQAGVIGCSQIELLHRLAHWFNP